MFYKSDQSQDFLSLSLIPIITYKLDVIKHTGQTKKKTWTCTTEDEKADCNKDAENRALHAHRETHGDIPWDETKTISVERVWF